VTGCSGVGVVGVDLDVSCESALVPKDCSVLAEGAVGVWRTATYERVDEQGRSVGSGYMGLLDSMADD
jgi:hypothetical protein